MITAVADTPLLKAVQNASSQELWIGQPSFLLDTPEPARLSANVDATLSAMRAAGFNGSTLYFGAHSLGNRELATIRPLLGFKITFENL